MRRLFDIGLIGNKQHEPMMSKGILFREIASSFMVTQG